jgi:hypothetical protein
MVKSGLMKPREMANMPEAGIQPELYRRIKT